MKQNDTKVIRDILTRFFAGDYSPEAEKGIQQWLISDGSAEEKEAGMSYIWNNIPVIATKGVYASLKAVKRKLDVMAGTSAVRRSLSITRVMARVAAVLLPAGFVFGGYFAWERYAGTPELLTMETPYGRVDSLVLADGTGVWLNAGSRIQYPAKFRGGKREVTIEGEVMFDVTQYKRKPFVVVSDNMVTEVLGTRFSVSSYAGRDNAYVTVLSGKVKVTTGNNESHVLTTDNRLTFHKNDNSANISDCDAGSVVGWRNNHLVFENDTFKDMLDAIECYYNIPVRVADSALLRNATGRYNIKFINDEPVEYVMETLGVLMGGFQYAVTDEEILVGGGSGPL